MGLFVLEHKSEAFSKFKHWRLLVENQTSKKLISVENK